MVTDFSDDGIATCQAVLLEVFTILGSYRDAMILVGGWVPSLLFPEKRHLGSLDIDIAVDETKITEDQYATILDLLKARGYRPGKEPNQFERVVHLPGKEPRVVRIDLLAAEYGGSGKSHRHQTIQQLKARKARGADLAFDSSSTQVLTGALPDGGENSISIRVARLVPFLVMKGMAIYDRMKEKDAYDIYFCVKHCDGGPQALVKDFESWTMHQLVKEGLGKIRAKFDTVDAVGPTWAARILESQGEDFEQIRRDAFEQVKVLLDGLGIQAWEG
jgi:hypothetical protein